MSTFFCDTNGEIEFDRFEALKVKLIRMPYTVNGEQFIYDLGEKTDRRGFFDQMRKGASVKTQALNQMDYIEYFEPELSAGNDIIYVSFSHEMSGTFQSMDLAIKELKEKYPDRKITVVDTKGISLGAGMVQYYAALKHNEGASDEEIVKFVETMRTKARCYFTVADLEYLKRGGRLSSFKAFMGTLFNLKPVISMMETGRLENIAKINGRKKALKSLVEYLDSEQVDLSYPIGILNADSDPDAALTKELVLEKYPEAKFWEQLVGPVIGCHCGPDTIGLVFIKK